MGEFMTIRLSVIAIAMLAACSTSEAPPAPEAPATLSNEAFQALMQPIQSSQNAFKKESLIKADEDFTALLARSDLTDDQRARVFYARGFSRGNFVRDFPRAFPQCAVLDYREMERVSPDHRLIETMKENRRYQFHRFQYFPNAPADCQAEAVAYREDLVAAGERVTWP